MPTQWETGNFLRSITYDSKRHRLLATDRTGKSLFAFDIGDSEWSLIRNNLRDGIGVIYDANKDAIVILCQRRVVGSNANEQKTWLTYLDSAGKQTSELPLECDQPLSTYLSRAANELTLTEKYLIAVQPPASNQRIPAEAIIRVFDLATGEKLYDHMMEPEKGVAKYTAIPPNIKPTRYAVYREQIEAIGEQINKISKQDAEVARKFDERLATTLSLAPKVDNVTGLVDGDRAVENVLKKLEELSAELDKLL